MATTRYNRLRSLPCTLKHTKRIQLAPLKLELAMSDFNENDDDLFVILDQNGRIDGTSDIGLDFSSQAWVDVFGMRRLFVQALHFKLSRQESRLTSCDKHISLQPRTVRCQTFFMTAKLSTTR